MLDNLKKYDIVLASGSPRRKELLSGLGLNFNVSCLPDIDESYPDNLPAEETAGFISAKKADAYARVVRDNQLYITADTIVVCDGKVLGKPQDSDDAIRILELLSGNTHLVVTGVTLLTIDRRKTFSVTTEVTFAKMSLDEIQYYVENYQPLDKAGAYGIQEWIGYIGVERIAGSYFNVMGLPVQRLYTELKNW